MSTNQNPDSFSEWVRTRRRALDLTQAELGKRAGCSAAAIRKLEADERKPSLQLAETLARALEIPEADRDIFLQRARGILAERFPRPPVATRPANPNNLPALLNSSIDRTGDLHGITSLIKDPSIRLVTLIGPPGIGKTRLSIQSGTELFPDFPDGIWFVDLAELENGAFFAAAVSRSLDFLELPQSPDTAQLITRLKNHKVLLILDNFEHIVEQAAVEVALILKSSPELKIIATSRVPLHISGEHEYPLPPLSTPPRRGVKDPASLMSYEAVQLLVARTRQHHPKFTVSPENASLVIEICNTLEGIPLALEFAAASLRKMTLDEMVSLLKGFRSESWMREIGTPARDLPSRQRTLENVVAWSYTLLTEPQQDLFCKLGVFSGWFDDEAVAAICFDEPTPSLETVHDQLDDLCEQSLLVRDFQNGIPCWRMLELIHEYASLRIDSGLLAHIRSRHAHYFLHRLDSINQGTDKEKRNNYYHLHASNLHLALKWAIECRDTELGFKLAWQMDDLWMAYGYSKEGLELLKQLIALPDQSPPEMRISRLDQAADLAWQKHDFQAGLVFTRESGEVAKKHGLYNQYLWFLNRQGRICIEQGLYNEARQALEACLAEALANPSIMNPGIPLAQLGELSLFDGKLDEAKKTLEKSIDCFSHSPDPDNLFISMAQVDLAEIALVRKDYEMAHARLIEGFKFAKSQFRRTLAFLVALAGYLVLQPDGNKQNNSDAAKFLGNLENLSEQSDIVLGPFYQKIISERITQGKKKLPASEWDKAYQTGRDLSEDEMFALASTALKMLT